MADTVEFENAVCVGQTEIAILVKLEDREDPIWFPQSQVDDASEVYARGHQGKLVVTEWIAIEKGLI